MITVLHSGHDEDEEADPVAEIEEDAGDEDAVIPVPHVHPQVRDPDIEVVEHVGFEEGKLEEEGVAKKRRRLARERRRLE